MRKLNKVDLWDLPVRYAKVLADTIREEIAIGLHNGEAAANVSESFYLLKQIEEKIAEAEVDE